LTAAGQTVSALVSDWALETTEVTDLPDDDFAEADTVVAAPAFDPTDTSREAAAVTDPAPAAQSSPDTDAPSTAESTPRSGSEAAPAQPPQEASESSKPETSTEPEDLSDADLSLLEPLPPQEPPQVGAIFRGRIGAVAESGHIAIVNRIVDKAAVRKAIRAARAQHQRVQGVVYGFNRGGFDVLVGGIRAFCPASAMSLTPIEDPHSFIGQRCEFSLPQDKGGKKSIIVSRRNILEKEARKRARERMDELEVGAKLKGNVTEVRDYGILVDLGGGLDGLVHMSEVSWGRGVRPQDAAQVGDEVDVEVIKLQPATRKDRYGRVSLSMRACQPDPWDAAKDTLRPGAPIKGKVVRTTDFGAFIEIEENIEGLLHISELGGSKELTHAKQAVSEGDEIDVVIERVDKEQRRISLSKLSEADAKAIEAGEIEFGKAPRSLKPGSHVAVVIKRLEHAGAQVQVDGMLGKRGRGFIPNRELQDARGDKRKALSQGDVVDVKVIGTERDGTLRCSIRARLLDEERKAVREYRKESAKQGLGTFGDLLKAKLEGGSE
jgi:small subunit ribosomal protein S1